VESLPSVKTDTKYHEKLLELNSRDEIPEQWRDTPIEALIMAQNSGWPIHSGDHPQVLIVTCIEFRYTPPIPRMYAYMIRRASGRLVGSEFSVGYVISRGVKHLVLIGHNDCGMVKVTEHGADVVDALADQGWNRTLAQQFVRHYTKKHKIADELGALEGEYVRLCKLFPKLVIAPLFVNLYDSKLYLPKFFVEHKPTIFDQVPDDDVFNLIV
jgi:carbonic anhydrase